MENKPISTYSALAAACNSAHKWNILFYWGSVLIWSIGFFTAFLLSYFG